MLKNKSKKKEKDSDKEKDDRDVTIDDRDVVVYNINSPDSEKEEPAKEEKEEVAEEKEEYVGDDVVTAGGRVLGVVAIEKDLVSAIEKSYSSVKKVHFDNAFYRNDIGAKALKVLKEG